MCDIYGFTVVDDSIDFCLPQGGCTHNARHAESVYFAFAYIKAVKQLSAAMQSLHYGM